jgi:WD40 repeat protein
MAGRSLISVFRYWAWWCLMPLLGAAGLAGALAQPGTPPPAKKSQPRCDLYGDPLPPFALGRLGTGRLHAAGYVSAAAMSSDGKLVAFAASGLDLTISDAVTGKELRTLKTGYHKGELLAFSPDGKMLAAATGKNDELNLFDATTGRPLQKFKLAAENQLSSMAFATSGNALALGGQSYGHKGTVQVVEPESGKQLAQFEVLQNYAIRVSMAADGKLAATWGHFIARGSEKDPEASGTLQIWDIAAAKELRRLKLEQGSIAAAALAPNGKLVAAVNGGATVRIWDVETGKEVCRLAGRRGLGTFVSFSPDSKTVAVGTYDGFIQMWDTGTAKRLGTWQGPRLRFGAVVWPSSGKALAWGVDQQAIRIWEVATNKPLSPDEGHTSRIAALNFVAKGKKLQTTGADGKVCLWDTATTKQAQRFAVHKDDKTRPGSYDAAPVFALLATSEGGKHLIAAPPDSNAARLWDLSARQGLCDFECNNDVQALALSADGKTAACAARDRVARVWDVDTGKELCQVKIPDGEFRHLTFAPNGKALAMAWQYPDRTINKTMCEVWVVDIATGAKALEWKRPNYFTSALAFSHDGKVLAVASGEVAVIHLLAAGNGKELGKLETGSSPFRAIAFSPDGRTLAAATQLFINRSEILLFELATKKLRWFFVDQPGTVDTLAYSPDARVLATAGGDTTVLLWDLTGQLGREANPPEPTAKELQNLWTDLTDMNGQNAFRSMLRLSGVPKKTTAFLQDKVKPAPVVKVDEQQVAMLLRALDDDKYPVREKAHKELAKIGPPAAEALRKALADKPSPEKRKRLQALLEKAESRTLTPELLQALRSVEVLEFIGDAGARQVLAGLAAGAPTAPVTQDARSALMRLQEFPAGSQPGGDAESIGVKGGG